MDANYSQFWSPRLISLGTQLEAWCGSRCAALARYHGRHRMADLIWHSNSLSF